MEASTTFENILQQIQNSHLNFKLELSPFSANISLKKSFIRNKAGIVLSPPCSSGNIFASDEQVEPKCSVIKSYEAKIKVLEDEVSHLEAKNASLTMNSEEVTQCETLHNKS